MYDYWLGGKDHFEADRRAAEAIRRTRPNVAEQALGNKKFQTRAVSYVASHGVRQFVDIGSGLPTSPVQEDGQAPLWRSTHEAATGVVPDAVVAYVDYDPVAVLHSQVFLAKGTSRVVAISGDMRGPEAILGHHEVRGAGFDLREPACVILGCVLHFVDAETADGIVGRLTGMLAPGSYLVISVGYARAKPGPTSPAPTMPRTARGSTPTPGSRLRAYSMAWRSCRRASWTSPAGRRNSRSRRPGGPT
jgi:O-methyltransferase involved in polyketide biosynthesis